MFEDHRKAFATLKTSLANATLHHLTENSKLFLTADASDTAMGAALHEITDNSSRTIAFFSRRLTAAERKYSAFDNEFVITHDSSGLKQRIVSKTELQSPLLFCTRC